MFSTLCLPTGDIMCTLILELPLPTIIRFLSVFPFSNIQCRFQDLYSRIYIALPEFHRRN